MRLRNVTAHIERWSPRVVFFSVGLCCFPGEFKCPPIWYILNIWHGRLQRSHHEKPAGCKVCINRKSHADIFFARRYYIYPCRSLTNDIADDVAYEYFSPLFGHGQQPPRSEAKGGRAAHMCMLNVKVIIIAAARRYFYQKYIAYYSLWCRTSLHFRGPLNVPHQRSARNAEW